MDTTQIPPGCTTVPCDRCNRPVGIYPPVDGYDTTWRCGRCARRTVATRVTKTPAGPPAVTGHAANARFFPHTRPAEHPLYLFVCVPQPVVLVLVMGLILGSTRPRLFTAPAHRLSVRHAHGCADSERTCYGACVSVKREAFVPEDLDEAVRELAVMLGVSVAELIRCGLGYVVQVASYRAVLAARGELPEPVRTCPVCRTPRLRHPERDGLAHAQCDQLMARFTRELEGLGSDV